MHFPLFDDENVEVSYRYAIFEVPADGYTSGYTIKAYEETKNNTGAVYTNTKQSPETVEVMVDKVWQLKGTAVPDSAVVQLYQDGAAYGSL